MKALVDTMINVLEKMIHDGKATAATKKQLAAALVSQPGARSQIIANSSRRRIDQIWSPMQRR